MSNAPTSAGSFAAHVAATLRVGMPLAGAQLAQIMMGVTDTVLLGRLGPGALAAGGLGTSFELTTVLVLQGLVGVVSVFVAQVRGAGRPAEVANLFWSAATLSVLLSLPAIAALSGIEGVMRFLGEPETLARDTGTFLHTLRWCVPAAMFGAGLFRAFLPAIDAGWLILPVTLVHTVLNGLLCYGLINGIWFLPELGLRGPAMATVISSGSNASCLALLIWLNPDRRRFVQNGRASLRTIAAMARLGLPIAGTIAVEAGLFSATSLLMGFIGPVALAAHQVALTLISVAFMIPLGLAQAANVRVAFYVGAAQRLAARRAGLTAIGLGALFEAGCALASLLAPHELVALFLSPGARDSTEIAVSLLQIAAVFQIADGIQCVASGALRGLGDARTPFLLAATGYWCIGFPAEYVAITSFGLGPRGGWWGLAAGLIVTAALLTARFLRKTRQGARLRALPI